MHAGRARPLCKCFHKAIAPNKNDYLSLIILADNFFDQVDEKIAAGTNGPDAFQLLLRLLSGHFDQGDRNAAYQRLQAFGVRNRTSSSDYLKEFRVVASRVTGTEQHCSLAYH